MQGVRLIAVLVTADELAELEEIREDLGLENLGHALRTCLHYARKTTVKLEEAAVGQKKAKPKVRDGMGKKRRGIRSQLDLWRRRRLNEEAGQIDRHAA